MSVDIEALKLLCEQATPGPWEPQVWIETDGNEWRATGPGHEANAHDHGSEPGCPDERAAQADAAFIAAAREAVPALIARVEATEKERDAAVREADRWRHGVTIEGDFVCPADLERDTLRARLEAVTKERDEARRDHANQRERDGIQLDLRLQHRDQAIAERDAVLERWAAFSVCIECGKCAADEDGCCATCGRDCLLLEDGRLINRDFADNLEADIRRTTERDTAERIAQFAIDEADAMDVAWKHAPTKREADACRQKERSLRQFAADIRANAWKGRTDGE